MIYGYRRALTAMKSGVALCRREFSDSGYWLDDARETTVRRDAGRRLRRHPGVRLVASLPGMLVRYAYFAK